MPLMREELSVLQSSAALVPGTESVFYLRSADGVVAGVDSIWCEQRALLDAYRFDGIEFRRAEQKRELWTSALSPVCIVIISSYGPT